MSTEKLDNHLTINLSTSEIHRTKMMQEPKRSRKKK
jgi:hypothetical protein